MSTLDPRPVSFAATQEAVARCRRYRMENGLYGVVESPPARIVLEAGPVGAVTMPVPLGKRVRALLLDHARPSPIIGHLRSGRWTFLTGPVGAVVADEPLLADLLHQGVDLALPGARVVLPSPADESTGYRVWIEPPHGCDRPDLTAILAATRACRAAHR
ncbi:hypothetical protein [Nocardia stercoris]|uniref:DNA-directed RNA polymerase subunit beta n=1 Tax=Nocardia stercoris TaxID=2483361 RepID=A0A3M2L9I3_9NOCA|nr:hypothetical protein [Nocardia stercoris]RMI34074.1 hypothetical protein EBN03_06455 [Nocardia stercoris]